MQHFTDCHVDPLASRATEKDLEGADVLILSLAGIGCPNCASRVRNALLAEQGVVDVEVALTTSLATVWYHKLATNVTGLVDAVAAAGQGTHHQYLAVPISPSR